MPLPDCLVRYIPHCDERMTPFIVPWNSYSLPSEATASEKRHLPCNPHILIVEDNPDNAFLAQYISESAGYIPYTAATGADALHLFDQQSFDLILLDIVLPDMDGFAVLQEMHRRHPTLNVPIIAVTAMAYPWQQQHILKAGFNDYLCKPYTLEAMEAILQKYCSSNEDVYAKNLSQNPV